MDRLSPDPSHKCVGSVSGDREAGNFRLAASENEARRGAFIDAVAPGSPAARAGVRPGDRALRLNGHPLRDVLDYQFYLEAGPQALDLERNGSLLTLSLELDMDDDPGMVFARALFDKVHTCRNRCRFCFVDQLPPGLRRPLYLKDDDYRLSFLHGNFITLNGLAEADRERIAEQRLSPLYVSVHATDPVVRAGLMGCSKAAAAAGLDCLRRLGEAGIELHAQVVLCPGVNDGGVLEATLADLVAYPGIASVGIVPVALAADGGAAGNGEGSGAGPGAAATGSVPGAGNNQAAGRPLEPVTRKDCHAVVESVDAWQERCRRDRGTGFVYAADEFYLRARLPLPARGDYDGFPQYENGIGIAASFVDDLLGLAESLYLEGLPPGRVFLLSGELAAPLVEFACKKLTLNTGGRFEPLVAANRLFGGHVTVTGLLGGRDILAAAGSAGLSRGDLLLLPSCCLESSGVRFLDDVTLAELSGALPGEVRNV